MAQFIFHALDLQLCVSNMKQFEKSENCEAAIVGDALKEGKNRTQVE